MTIPHSWRRLIRIITSSQSQWWWHRGVSRRFREGIYRNDCGCMTAKNSVAASLQSEATSMYCGNSGHYLGIIPLKIYGFLSGYLPWRISVLDFPQLGSSSSSLIQVFFTYIWDRSCRDEYLSSNFVSSDLLPQVFFFFFFSYIWDCSRTWKKNRQPQWSWLQFSNWYLRRHLQLERTVMGIIVRYLLMLAAASFLAVAAALPSQ